jgi:serine/threonine protein kinase
MGEQINGYELTTPFQSENAGFSRWAFATRKGKAFFLKEFMDPTYPDEESLSPALRETRIADCKAFENEKSKLYETINAVSDGNTVKIFEFFRYDSHYYISSPKVEGVDISFEEIAELPLEDRVLLCRTAAHSIMKLHEVHVVHSDIKNTNVLIQRTATGKLIAKIIDFDCSFFEENPPGTEEDLGGDQVYLSPEACQLVCGDPIQLTCKTDVFAFGLLFHQYLTGELPGFNRAEFDYANEAVLDGQELNISDKLPEQLREMLKSMLVCEPQNRISMAEVYETLGGYLSDCQSVIETEACEPPKPEVVPDVRKPQDFFFTAGDL